ncbi:MAG: HD domain-containing phosphohydrolase [Gallionella sp.]
MADARTPIKGVASPASKTTSDRSALLFMLEDLERSRQHVEQAHQEWMAALDVVSDAIFLHDKEFRVLRCNRAYQKLAGIPFKEILGQPYYKIFPKIDAPSRSCLWSAEMVEGQEEVVSGGRTYRSRAFSIKDKRGQYLCSVHSFDDITERKQNDAKLAESEEKFRSITATAQDAIVMMGADRRISLWNAAAERMFGYTGAEAIGQDLHALITSSWDQAGFAHAFPQFMVGGEGRLIGKVTEVKALRKGGELFPVEISLSATKIGGQWHAIGILRDITERARAAYEIAHAARSIAALGAVNRELVHATNEGELLLAICQIIIEQAGYKLAWVGYVQYDEEKSIRVMAHVGDYDEFLDHAVFTWAEDERGMCPAGRAVRSGVSQVSQDIANDENYAVHRDSAVDLNFASSIAIPLLREGKQVFAVLHIYSDEVYAFTPGEIKLLEEMAGDLSYGIRSLHTSRERDLALRKIENNMAQQQRSLEDTVRAIASIAEMRDPYTSGHQLRVADLAAAIARKMGLPADHVNAIQLAGTVHDLGKIRIPAEILSKPGRITEIEYNLIKIHPQAGYEILKGIEFPWPIADMVLQHHERLDGSGYPNGLKGGEILLGARILSVADVVEAISAHRPYRPGLGIDAALEEVTSKRGIYYDAQVVDACLAVFREHGYAFPGIRF